jgi:hypothetical protein
VLMGAVALIPHREYWLHPDRHASSMGYVPLFMNWIAVAFSLFAMAISHMVFMANRDGVGLDTVWLGVIMTVLLVTKFLSVAMMFYHFRLPSDSTLAASILWLTLRASTKGTHTSAEHRKLPGESPAKRRNFSRDTRGLAPYG